MPLKAGFKSITKKISKQCHHQGFLTRLVCFPFFFILGAKDQNSREFENLIQTLSLYECENF